MKDEYYQHTDFELITLINTGDKKAFTQIFFRYNRFLYAHAYKMLGNKEEAKDIVQEIFAMLWKNHATLSLKTTLPGFLYASTKNKILDLLGHKAVVSKYLDTLGVEMNQKEEGTDYRIRTKELSTLIDNEIDLLPEKMKEIFILSRKEALSHKEIAIKLDITEKTVKNQINNALKILRTKLGMLIYLIFLFSQHIYKF
ncbi:RNA polymerase sigma factor [Pedobacter sp. MW01-1-1]|uniref:RNA polymerase sigma factor n=1 Tax=Pedobacter sp. MW01-1-1 TaxID=3383027 RepID=UPI003FEED97D